MLHVLLVSVLALLQCGVADQLWSDKVGKSEFNLKVELLQCVGSEFGQSQHHAVSELLQKPPIPKNIEAIREIVSSNPRCNRILSHLTDGFWQPTQARHMGALWTDSLSSSDSSDSIDFFDSDNFWPFDFPNRRRRRRRRDIERDTNNEDRPPMIDSSSSSSSDDIVDLDPARLVRRFRRKLHQAWENLPFNKDSSSSEYDYMFDTREIKDKAGVCHQIIQFMRINFEYALISSDPHAFSNARLLIDIRVAILHRLSMVLRSKDPKVLAQAIELCEYLESLPTVRSALEIDQAAENSS